MPWQTMFSAYVIDHDRLIAIKAPPTDDPDYLEKIVARERDVRERIIRASKIIVILAAFAATFLSGESLPDVAGFSIPDIPARLEILCLLMGFSYLRFNQVAVEWAAMSTVVRMFVARRFGPGATSHAVLHIDSTGVPGELMEAGLIPVPARGRAAGAAKGLRNTIGLFMLLGIQLAAVGTLMALSIKIDWFPEDMFPSFIALLGLFFAIISFAYTLIVFGLPRDR